MSELALDGDRPFDPTAPLTGSGNLPRRMLVSRLFAGGATLAALIAVAMLFIVLYAVARRGASVLNLDFIIQDSSGLVGGGIANYLLGTLVVVAVGAAIAVPIGVLTGLYLTEFAGRRSPTGRALTLALDLLQGIPTIVAGLFVYGLIVAVEHRESGWAGSVALAIVMLPLIARSSQEVLLLVPGSLREAADALGVARWRTVLTIILPSAVGGIATGALLATARAAGETAPMLVVNALFDPNSTQLNLFGHGVPTIPMLILDSYDLAVPQAFARAWGAAFVLMIVILFANLLARLLLARNRTKLGR